MSQLESQPTVFVWRGKEDIPDPADDSLISRCCPFCGSFYSATELEDPSLANDFDDWESHSSYACNLCGFWYLKKLHAMPGIMWSMTSLEVAILKEMNINDGNLAIAELRGHLRKRFDDIYALSPRRFEYIVADVFSNIGYKVHLTQQTRDGGYDILLLDKGDGRQTIVECKRYAKNRKVSVKAIRELLGVQNKTRIRSAKFVTTSGFTGPAREAASEARVSEYELDLVDAEKFARALNILNPEGPSLSKLSVDQQVSPLDTRKLRRTLFIKGQGTWRRQ